MKSMKSRIVALALTLAMVVSTLAVPVSAAAPTVTNEQAAQFLQEKGLLKGDGQNLNLDQTLTRQDSIIILSRLLGKEDEAKTYDVSGMTFLDVTDEFYAPYVAWAQANNYVKGYSPEQFGFGDLLTVGQVKTILCRALGFQVANEEVDSKADELELTKSLTAGSESSAARADVALMMYNALYAKNAEGKVLGQELKVLAAPVAPVLSEVKASATTTSAATVTVTGKVTPATAKVKVGSVDATVAADGAFTAEAALVVGENKVAVVATNDEVTDTEELTVTKVDKPAVDTVETNGLRMVTVKFNGPVDETSAEATGNYTISGFTVLGCDLQADGQTVALLLNSALTNNKEYTLTVEDVKNSTGTKMDAAQKVKFTAKDYAIPTATVTVKGNSVVEIQFSEPVDNSDKLTSNHFVNYELDDKALTDNTDDSAHVQVTINPPVNDMFTKATINFNQPLTVGEHDFEIVSSGASSSIVDFAGYKVAPIKVKLDVTTESTIPTVDSVEVKDQTTAVVKFTKGMAIPEGTSLKDAFYWNATGNVSDTSKKATTVKDKIDDQTFEVKFTDNPMKAGKIYFFVKSVGGKEVTDYSSNEIFGNTTTDHVFKTEVTVPGNELPTIKSVASEDSGKITVVYSTDMDKASAEKKGNYTLKDSDGDTVSISSIVYSVNDKEAVITLPGGFDNGVYNLKIANVEDLIDNKIATQSFEVTVKDEAELGLTSIEWKDNVAIITFDGKVATSGDNSALDEANYKLDDDELPGGTELEVIGDGDQVRLTLPDTNDDFGGDYAELTIGYFEGATVHTVADLAGNLFLPSNVDINNNTGSAADGDADDARVTPISANIDLSSGATFKIVSPTEIEVTVSSGDPQLDTLEADDFVVTVDGETADVTGAEIDEDDARVFTLTIDEDNKIGASAVVTLDTIASPASEDVFGATIATVGAPVAVTNNEIKPELVAAAVIASDKLYVAFDGKIDVTQSNLDLFKSQLIVTQGDVKYSASELGTVDTLSGSDDKVLIFTLSDASFDLEKEVTVKTVAQDFLTAEGANGGKLQANTTGVTADGLVAYKVDADSNTVEDGTEFTLDFNRNIDYKTIKDTSWSSAVTLEGSLNEDGDLEISGLGTISGLLVSEVDSSFNVTVAKVSDTELTATVHAGTFDGLAAVGESAYFVAESNIKSVSGAAFNTDFETTVTVLDALVADSTDPSVTTPLTAGQVAAAGGTRTIVFSEALSYANRAEVEDAIDEASTQGTLAFSWSADGLTLTITNNHATNATNFASTAITADLTDVYGNTATAETIIDLP